MRLVAAAALVALVGTALPNPSAADECNALLSIATVSGPAFGQPGGPGVGTEFRKQVMIGTDTVDPDGPLTVERFRFALDCVDVALIDFCTDEGDVVRWMGGEAASNCLDEFASPVGVTCDGADNPGGPNVVTCEFSSPVKIDPLTTPANGCVVGFDLRMQGFGSDSSPNIVQQGAGFSNTPEAGNSFDADCFNNAGPAAISQPTTLQVCPDCDDGDVCTMDFCDGQTGECINEPIPGCGQTRVPMLPPVGMVAFGSLLLGGLLTLTAAVRRQD